MRKAKKFIWPGKEGKELIQVFLKLKKTAEMETFLRDICTIAELQAMTERWQAAKLLQQGLPYREVATKTGLSTTTVARVAHWLHHGAGGYQFLFEQMT